MSLAAEIRTSAGSLLIRVLWRAMLSSWLIYSCGWDRVFSLINVDLQSDDFKSTILDSAEHFDLFRFHLTIRPSSIAPLNYSHANGKWLNLWRHTKVMVASIHWYHVTLPSPKQTGSNQTFHYILAFMFSQSLFFVWNANIEIWFNHPEIDFFYMK